MSAPSNQHVQVDTRRDGGRRACIGVRLVAVMVALGKLTHAAHVPSSPRRFPPTTQGVFPNGDADLVHHFMFRANEYMAVHLSTLPLKDMTVNERIKAGVKARLEYIVPVISQWPQAMGIGALPQNLPRTLQLLLDMADEIWYSAGDRSADFTWYTRRGLLIGVYTATELCMLTDKSAGYRDTWEFLDRRLKDVSSFGQQVGEVMDCPGSLFGFITIRAGRRMPSRMRLARVCWH